MVPTRAGGEGVGGGSPKYKGQERRGERHVVRQSKKGGKNPSPGGKPRRSGTPPRRGRGGAAAPRRGVRCSGRPLLGPPPAAPLRFPGQRAPLLGQVLQTKAAVAGKHEAPRPPAPGWWPSNPLPSPALTHLANGGGHAFDRVGVTLGLGVDLWRSDEHDWTLVGLAAAPSTPVILLFEGDWTGSAQDLVKLARELSGTTRGGRAPWALDAAARRLTRMLADTTGLAAVGEAVLALRRAGGASRIASLAVATGDGELSIVATLGYPHALVEHLKIAPGTGVIGTGFINRASARCSRRQRESRARSSAFAVPNQLVHGDSRPRWKRGPGRRLADRSNRQRPLYRRKTARRSAF